MAKGTLQCPRCHSFSLVKDGIVRNKQRYNCKDCSFHFTRQSMLNAESERSLKRKAIILYLEGFSFRPIARLLNVSHSSVQNWVKEYGNDLGKLRSRHKPELFVSGGLKAPEINAHLEKRGEKQVSSNWLIIGIDVFTAFTATGKELKEGK